MSWEGVESAVENLMGGKDLAGITSGDVPAGSVIPVVCRAPYFGLYSIEQKCVCVQVHMYIICRTIFHRKYTNVFTRTNCTTQLIFKNSVFSHGLILGYEALKPGSPALGKFYVVTDGPAIPFWKALDQVRLSIALVGSLFNLLLRRR